MLENGLVQYSKLIDILRDIVERIESTTTTKPTFKNIIHALIIQVT